jgi:hypothetical protein
LRSGPAELPQAGDAWRCYATRIGKFPPTFWMNGQRASTASLGTGISPTHQRKGVLLIREGLLQMDWPPRVEEGAAVDLDLLLVSANDPTFTGTPPSYPRVETIANAWNAAQRKRAEYFWNNTDNGITTFQDTISARVSACGIRRKSRHSDAVNPADTENCTSSTLGIGFTLVPVSRKGAARSWVASCRGD